jgi:hypothetical protein
MRKKTEVFDGIWKKVGRAVAGLNSEYSGFTYHSKKLR